MCSVIQDIDNTLLAVRGKDFPNYHRLYFSSNEYLKDIFENLNVFDKKVLTVSGSGDQLFHFYNNGAKDVDVFDKNKLTIYYLYLRIWTIIYLGMYYPPVWADSEFFNKLLNLVKINSEEENNAYQYWRIFKEKFLPSFYSHLFLCDNHKNLNKINDLDFLVKQLNENRFSFYNVDISKSVEIPKKYDIIFASNIKDYITDELGFDKYKENIDQLLKKEGILISTNVCGTGPSFLEDYFFSSDYILEDVNGVAYAYRKRI